MASRKVKQLNGSNPIPKKALKGMLDNGYITQDEYNRIQKDGLSAGTPNNKGISLSFDGTDKTAYYPSLTFSSRGQRNPNGNYVDTSAMKLMKEEYDNKCRPIFVELAKKYGTYNPQED